MAVNVLLHILHLGFDGCDLVVDLLLLVSVRQNDCEDCAEK